MKYQYKKTLNGRNTMCIDWNELATDNGWVDDKEMLITIYAVEKSTKQTGCLLDISGQSVINRLKYHKIKRRPSGGANYKGNPDSANSLIQANRDRLKDMTAKEISLKHNITLSQAYKILNKHKIQYKKIKIHTGKK